MTKKTYSICTKDFLILTFPKFKTLERVVQPTFKTNKDNFTAQNISFILTSGSTLRSEKPLKTTVLLKI